MLKNAPARPSGTGYEEKAYFRQVFGRELDIELF
jgi:hypothetical protein